MLKRVKNFYLFSIIFCLSVIKYASAEGFYKVIGPRTIRPNSEFHVAVATHSISIPTTIAVAVVGTSSLNGRSYTVEDSAIVLPFSTRIIRLKIDDIDEGFYKLVARGTGGVEFQSTALLDFVKKSYSVFIQTDKSVYDPGQKVLFRVLTLNSDLKPAAEVRNEPVSVFITDGKGLKVKQWNGVSATRGVFSEELLLSSSPNLGNWNISVVINDQVYNKTFYVAQHVHPKFIVTIDAPKQLTFQENILVVNLKSEYESGKKVRGDVTVTVYPTINSGVIQPIFQQPVRKVYPINGALTVNFDISKELKLSDEYERAVVIDAVVEEELTGRRQNNSIEVHLHKYDYKMELIKSAHYFKPGMQYVVFIKVSNHDGTPLQNDRRSVSVKHGFSRADEDYTKKKIVLNRHGLYKLEIETPKFASNETALRIEAEYYDLRERMPPVPAAVSFSNNFLQIHVQTDRPIVNQDIEVLVNCTEPMEYISYELLGRGDLVIANTVKIDHLKEFRFHFTATHAMTPVSHLLVSYVRNDGELIADSIDIHVDGILQNFIDIQTNALETNPGTDIDFTIRSQPNSYIGLMAIDQGVNNLRQGHDINAFEVADELHHYDSANVYPYLGLSKGMRDSLYWKQGSSNVYDMFFYSGANLLTNSFVTSRRPTLEDIYLRPVSYDSSTVKPDLGVGLNFHSVTRPPLAGPYAFSRIPRPVWDKPKVYPFDNLADTWLFNNFSSGFEGKTTIRRRIPPSLNTWVITGFSLNPLHGLGLVSTPKTIKVTKSFAVHLDLPHFIHKGEVLQVPVIVHNYLDKDIQAEVTLHNPEQKFTFTDEVSNELVPKVELFRRKRLQVKKKSSGSVSFLISPLRSGLVELKATASSSNSQDTSIKQLQVRNEGESQYNTKTILIDLTKSNTFKGNVSIDIPKNFVPGSESIEVSVVGNFLGPIISNLEEVIRLPVVSGEQNLLKFVPNLLILKYLQLSQQLTPTIQNDAVRNLETHFQQQLSFRRNDGSFSVYGKENELGSVWVTAYTALTLLEAKNFISIDPNLIAQSYIWLSNMQSSDGSFKVTSPILHKELQGDSNHLSLTAFVALSFMQNEIPESKYSNTINKALDYLARNIDEVDTPYTVAICSYVLQLANHPSKLSTLNLLDSKAKTAENLKWWGNPVPKKEDKNPWNKLPKSMEIEATSYALLTMLEANLIDDAMPVINWLVQQRNTFGGFTSSQDTRIGLYALYKASIKLGIGSNAQIEFTHKQESKRFNLNRDNALIVQKAQVNKNARQLNVSASGSGLVLFQVSYEFNMNVTGPWPLFTLDPRVDRNSDRYHLQLTACTSFVTRNLTNIAESNMVAMEVNLPSGFTADIDALPSLEVSQNVQRVLTKNQDTTVVLFFNNLTVAEYCPTVSAFQTHKVANQKPVAVVVYDYYDSSRRARIFYRGRRSSLCDICEDSDCGNACIAQANKQRADDIKDTKKNSGSKYSPSSIFGFLIISVVGTSYFQLSLTFF